MHICEHHIKYTIISKKENWSKLKLKFIGGTDIHRGWTEIYRGDRNSQGGDRNGPVMVWIRVRVTFAVVTFAVLTSAVITFAVLTFAVVYVCHQLSVAH